MRYSIVRWARVVLVVAVLAVAGQSTARAQSLSNPEACTGQMLDMMTDAMVISYGIGDMMCMPMMGMCEQMMGEFFSMILDSPELTMEFMDCAHANPELIYVMLDTIDANPELFYEMGSIMGMSCAFTLKLAYMAQDNRDLRDFFFGRITDHVYRNLTIALLCEPPEVAEQMGIAMEMSGADHLWPGSAFFHVLNNLGTDTDNLDANELANERLLLAFFRDVPAASSFLNTLGQLDEEVAGLVLGIFFLGEQRGPYDFLVVHDDQAYLHAYAMIRAIADGVLPHYNVDEPPDPSASTPANQLLGQMLPMFMTEEGGLSPYGLAFFRALRTGAEVYCDPWSQQLMAFFATLFPPEMMMAMPDANPDAPGPRSTYTGEEYPYPDVCTAATCAAVSPELCATPEECEATGANWCAGWCRADPCSTCASSAPELCATPEDCEATGSNWCAGWCMTDACPDTGDDPVIPDDPSDDDPSDTGGGQPGTDDDSLGSGDSESGGCAALQPGSPLQLWLLPLAWIAYRRRRML